MNKLVLIFLLVLSSLSGFSQNKIGDKHVVYIELLGKTSMFSTKVKVSVDLGQPLSETYKLRDAPVPLAPLAPHHLVVLVDALRPKYQDGGNPAQCLAVLGCAQCLVEDALRVLLNPWHLVNLCAHHHDGRWCRCWYLVGSALNLQRCGLALEDGVADLLFQCLLFHVLALK